MNRINTSEIIKEITQSSGISEKEVKIVYNTLFELILLQLKSGKSVVLRKFGTFQLKKSKKPTLEDTYNLVLKFTSSRYAKKVIND